MFESIIIAQASTVSAELFYWALGGMGLAVVSMAAFIKSIYTRAWDDLNSKHNEAMQKIEDIKAIASTSKARHEMNTKDLTETKYAIQTISRETGIKIKLSKRVEDGLHDEEN